MGTKYPEIFDRLAAEFPRDQVKSYSAGNRTLWYITARMVMNRFDEVLGPEFWDFEVVPWGENALIGTLTVRLPGGEVVKKSDVGGRAQMAKADDDTKSVASDCLKRCAVLLGVGRYLYNDGTPTFERREGTEGQELERPVLETKAQKLIDWCQRKGLIGQAQSLARKNFDRTLAQLGDDQASSIYDLLRQMRAVPEAEIRTEERRPPPGTREASRAPGNNANGHPRDFKWPHSGAALFAWCKDLEEAFRADLVRGVVDATFVRGQGWDRSWKTWDLGQVEEAAHAVAAAVATLEGYDGQFADKVPDAKKLRDRIWTAAAAIVEGLGGKPTSEAIEHQIRSISQHLAACHDGEIVDDLATCTNLTLLAALAAALEADLADAKAAF